MSSSKLLPSFFQRVHGRFRTPAVSILAFTAVAIVELIFAALPGLNAHAAMIYRKFFHGEDGITFLGDLYAFGAATSYSFVFIALIALRLFDPLSPRKFKIPFNIPMRIRGERVEFPIVAVIGFIGIGSILVFTMITHEIGRVAGPAWLICGLIGYLIYRRTRGLPVFRSQPRNWRVAQLEILRKSGELELMDEYANNLRESERRRDEARQS